MYSVRLTRRSPFIDDKCLTLEQIRLANRVGQGTTLPSFHRTSRQRDRHYARDVVIQSVFEWLHDSQKSSKQQKRYSRVQSASPTGKRHSTNHQIYDNSPSPRSSMRRSVTSSKTTKTKTGNSHELHQSSFPNRITTNHVTLQKDILQKDYNSLASVPQTFSISSIVEDKQYSCQITMTYQSDKLLSIDSHYVKRDEVTIFQETHTGYTFVAFKGFLKPGDTFSFKSQRSINDRFRLIICVNDLVDSCLSSCCEFKYQGGFRIDGNDGLFWIQNIDGVQPCRKCLEDIDISLKSPSPDNRRSPSTTSEISSRLKLPVINTNQSTPTIRSKSVSVTKSIAGDDINDSKIYTARDIDTDNDEFHAIISTTTSTVSLPIICRSSSSSTNLKWSVQDNKISKKMKNIAALTKFPSSTSLTSEKRNEKDDDIFASSNQIATTNTETTYAQSITGLLQSSMSHFEHPKLIPPRITGDVENFFIAWIGETTENQMIQLRPIINFIRIFDNIDALNTFLIEYIHIKVIILLPYNQAQSLIDQIHQILCIHSIYLFSTNKNEESSNWIKNYHKIIGVYQTIESIRDHLSKILPQICSTLIPVKSINENTFYDIPFTYCHLLKETMLLKDEESNLKQDLLDFARFHYANNSNEIKNIDEFEKDFIPKKVIWWYTKNCFIRKILNRAFHTQEIDLLYKMRYIIQCLHTELKTIAINEITTVYTVLSVPVDDAMKIQENLNGLLIFGGFLPAMLQKPQFLNIIEDNEQISIIFSIDLGSGYGAKVKHLSSDDSNIDVLIDIDTIFRIHSIEKTNDKQWIVNLKSVSSTDEQFTQVIEYRHNEITAPIVLLQLSKLLLTTQHYAECNYLAELLFTDKSHRNDPTLLASLAAVHHLLGNYDDERGDPKSACKQFLKSIRAFQAFLPPDHLLMSASYNNIGSMYFKDNDFDEAIIYHQKALDCQLKSTSPDTNAIATYSNNIGAVYFEQGKYSEALKYLERAVKVLETLNSPVKMSNLCIIYEKIAASYWRMDKAQEALEYYKKTLDIQLTYLPSTAHQISVTYFNLSTAYARVGQIDEAVINAEKSVEQLLKIYPPDHQEVKENQAQLEIVRQKQWLQQVLIN